MIFKTNRLVTRKFEESDADAFFDLMGNPNVMNPIPQKILNKKECNDKLTELLELGVENPDKKVYAIIENSNNEFIGFCALIRNEDNENEIVYRLREKCWGNGYGTEIATGLVNYCFDFLNLETITADVNIKNEKSVRILEKLMKPTIDFYNRKDNCINRRYKINNKNWSRMTHH